MASVIGVRDIDPKSDVPMNQLVEFYWDVILLMESKFMVENVDFLQFRKYLIDRFNRKVNYAKSAVPSLSFWRNIGDYYNLLYLPDFLNNLIYCKVTSDVILHITIQDTDIPNLVNHFKDVLLIFLEFADLVKCTKIRLYLNKNFNFIYLNKILKNLNWISGKVVKNENRDDNIPTIDDLMCSDENFIILEFDA